MQMTYLTWEEAVELFERRGLLKSMYENLYEEEYFLLPGSVSVAGALPLNDDDERHPWHSPEVRTGYIIDGDLTVDGNIYDWDDGAMALIVLGNLRAANIYFSCDPKLLVMGNVEAETFAGDMTDKLVMIQGDVRTTATLMWREFYPDQIDGCLYGRIVAPSYIQLPNESIARVEDPAPDVPLSELLVPEVFSDIPDGYDVQQGVHHSQVYGRITAGLPVIHGGRTVAALPPAPR